MWEEEEEFLKPGGEARDSKSHGSLTVVRFQSAHFVRVKLVVRAMTTGEVPVVYSAVLPSD